MPRPKDIAAIDTLIGFRSPADVDRNPTNVRPSQRGELHPADYMFRDIPATARPDDDDASVIADTLGAMDANGVGIDVQHQSPQLLIINKEKCVFNTSHFNISTSAIEKEINSLQQV